MTSKLLSPPAQVWDQAEVPCCVSMAVINAMQMMAAQPIRLSPLYHYYYARQQPRSLGDVSLSGGLSSACDRGVCALALHQPAMNESGARTNPSAAADADAPGHLITFLPALRIGAYRELQLRLDDFRAELDAERPVLLGIWTCPEYWALRGASSPVLSGATASFDGHAVVAVGYYDDAPSGGALRVVDSRGEKFGDRGQWLLPYSLASGALIEEAWVIDSVSF